MAEPAHAPGITPNQLSTVTRIRASESRLATIKQRGPQQPEREQLVGERPGDRLQGQSGVGSGHDPEALGIQGCGGRNHNESVLGAP